jgi:hypothetical protein
LFLPQLNAVLSGLLAAALTMLAGRIGAAFDGALIRVATLAFEKEFNAFPPAQAAHRTIISCHNVLLCFYS